MTPDRLTGGQEALAFVGISKSFPGVRALEGVSFSIAAGSVHALCGENGAGKSTLGKIVAGIHRADRGQLRVFGENVQFGSPREALGQGIGMVHQELSFCENLSVAENLCLGALPVRRWRIDRGAMDRRAAELLSPIDDSIDVRACVGELPLGQRQMLQIAAAVGAGARVIVFDEPTSSLSQVEAGRLYRLIGRLRATGVTSIYVSHRMDEIFRLCDAVTVLRDGRHVATRPIGASAEAELVSMMIGRAVEAPADPAGVISSTEEALRVSGLSSPGKLIDVSFTLHAGEILGLAGLVGAGRSEIAHAIFGLDPLAQGIIEVAGERVEVRRPAEALRHGLSLVPEDRKRQGLILQMSAQSNIGLPILDRLSRLTFIRHDEERALADSYFSRLRVKASNIEAVAAGLSGGNQQKLVLAKALATRSRILILDEPTRGVDVGAKAEIHSLIAQLAREGAAILLISSELPEVLRLASRILVVRAGKIVAEVAGRDASQAGLLRAMAGLAA